MIDIHFLADDPQFIPACASWAYGMWGTQKIDGSLDRAIKRFTESAQKNSIPRTLIALTNGLPAGMISLWQEDCEERPDLMPWLASLYVHPDHRNKGIALALINRLEKEAKKLGYNQLFLVTGQAAAYYKQRGWTEKEKLLSSNGLETIMSKPL